MAWDRSSLTLAPRNMNDNLIANNSCWNDGGSAQKRLARQLVGRFSLRHSFLSGLSYSPHHRICRCDNTFKTFSLRNWVRPPKFPDIQPYCRYVKQTIHYISLKRMSTIPNIILRLFQRCLVSGGGGGRFLRQRRWSVGLAATPLAHSLSRVMYFETQRRRRIAPSIHVTFHGELQRCHNPGGSAFFRATSGKSLPRATGAVQGKCWFA